MSKNKTVTEQYIAALNSAIPSSCTGKKEALKNTCNSIEQYVAENPDCSYDDILENFGTPEEVAEDFIELEPAAALREVCAMKKTRLIRFIVVIVLIFLGIYAIIRIQSSLVTVITMDETEWMESESNIDTQ